MNAQRVAGQTSGSLVWVQLWGCPRGSSGVLGVQRRVWRAVLGEVLAVPLQSQGGGHMPGGLPRLGSKSPGASGEPALQRRCCGEGEPPMHVHAARAGGGCGGVDATQGCRAI